MLQTTSSTRTTALNTLECESHSQRQEELWKILRGMCKSREEYDLILKWCAWLFCERGDLTSTREALQQSLQLLTGAYGYHHQETASCLTNLGLLEYHMPNREHHSLLSLRQAQEICLDIYETENNRYGAELNHFLALVFRKLELLDAAIHSLSKSLQIYKRLGTDWECLIPLYYYLADTYVEHGLIDYAIQIIVSLFQLVEARHGSSWVKVSSAILNDLGYLYREQGELDMASWCIGKALNVATAAARDYEPFSEQSHQPPRLHNADSYEHICKLLNTLGNLLLMKDDVGSAMYCYTKACRLGLRSDRLAVDGHISLAFSRIFPQPARVA